MSASVTDHRTPDFPNAFLDNFSLALRNELKDSGVMVTVLVPGPTDSLFFERADMLDIKVGKDDSKADPADVAKVEFDAMQDGDADAAAGWKNKLQVTLANIPPAPSLAEQHCKMAQPPSSGS